MYSKFQVSGAGPSQQQQQQDQRPPSQQMAVGLQPIDVLRQQQYESQRQAAQSLHASPPAVPATATTPTSSATIDNSQAGSPNHRLGRPTNKPPGGTAHACEPCRRRKSKCDGGPGRVCSRCVASRKEQHCVYMGHKPRNIPSQKLVDDLANSLNQYRTVVESLFAGDVDVSKLESLSRDEMLSHLVGSGHPRQTEYQQNPHQHDLNIMRSVEHRHVKHETTNSSSQTPSHTEHPSENSNVLEQLHGQIPVEFDEGSPDYVAEGDDVNALGLSVSQQQNSSYVGSSSISAALKIIAILCPPIMQQPNPLTAPSPSSSVRSTRDLAAYLATPIPPQMEAGFIEAYFHHVHPLHPMLNEYQFRHEYATGINQKRAWIGLLNMVLAMGSIAAQTSQETHHVIYYQRARQALNFDSFGSGRLETIQALALMGGLYLHYCNRPNMAVAITGAAKCMAYAMGIHRRSSLPQGHYLNRPQDPNSDAEVRRRTWWTLVCLDTWGSTTLGRPSNSDCFGPSITTPVINFDDYEGHQMQPMMQFLSACIDFTKIAAKMQDRLATRPCLGASEMASFDAQIDRAYQRLPTMLRTSEPYHKDLSVPRAILKWRFQNARILLHRPTLLAAALTRKSRDEISDIDLRSIETCRAIAADSIMDIACAWRPDHICGWNGAWMLFQAVMVPLVSLYHEPANAIEAPKWRYQIEMAMKLLLEMSSWSPVASKSREVVSQLYEASNNILIPSAPPDLSAWDPQAAFDLQDAWANNISAQVSEWSHFAFDSTAAYG